MGKPVDKLQLNKKKVVKRKSRVRKGDIKTDDGLRAHIETVLNK